MKNVGKTTRPEIRKQELTNQGHRNFKVVQSGLSKTGAQNLENKLGSRPGYSSNPGGRPPDNPSKKHTVYTTTPPRR